MILAPSRQLELPGEVCPRCRLPRRIASHWRARDWYRPRPRTLNSAGQRLLDSTGKRYIGSTGAAILDDGAGNDCCCGESPPPPVDCADCNGPTFNVTATIADTTICSGGYVNGTIGPFPLSWDPVNGYNGLGQRGSDPVYLIIIFPCQENGYWALNGYLGAPFGGCVWMFCNAISSGVGYCASPPTFQLGCIDGAPSGSITLQLYFYDTVANTFTADGTITITFGT